MDATIADPLVGRVLDGRYAVEHRLASGGMATVYRALDVRLDRLVAVKVMRPTLADDADFVARFHREAKAAARLSHPNVVAVFDQGSDAGSVFLVMEYVEGQTLRELLRRQGRLSPARALRVMEPVLSALGAAHAAGLVHRDIKPENVLLARDGTVKVADFGLARAVAATTLTGTTGLLIGTAAYLSPEQVERGVADPRSDVYAAGIVLFELLTGRPPYAGETPLSVAYHHVHDDVPAPSTLVTGVPPELDELVRRATARDPDRRPPHAGALLGDARRVAAVLPPERPAGAPDASTDVLVPGATRLVGGWHRGDSSTRVIGRPGVVPQAADPAPAALRRRPRRLRLLVAALLALATAAAAGAGAYGAGLLHRVHYVQVPALVGMSRTAAVAALQARHLVPVVAGTQRYDERVPAGSVVVATPAGRAAWHTRVTLTLSEGRRPVPVPDVGGDRVADAKQALTSAGFTVNATIAYQYDEQVPAQLVIRTNPPAAHVGHLRDRVTLVVSKGPRPIAVPTVTGVTLATARARLTSAGLDVGAVTRAFSDTVAKGVVVSSDPAAGANRHHGDTVALVVSKGPDVVAVPNVHGMSVQQATAVLEAAGFTVAVDNVFGGEGGNVLAQDPNPGEVVHRGSLVKLAVL